MGEVAASIAEPFAHYLRRQQAGGIEIIAIVGVSFSPACSAKRQAYHSNERGLFIEALVSAICEETPITVIDIDRTKAPSEITARLDALLAPATLFD